MIALGLVAAVLYNLGFVLEKKALGGLPALAARRPLLLLGNLLSAPVWMAGFALVATGLICQSVVLAHLPLAVAQPLQASGVVIMVGLSRLVLAERPRRAELACLAAVAVSVVLLALSGSGGAGGPLDSPLPLLVVGALTCALLLPRTRSSGGVDEGVRTGLLYGLAGLALKGLSSVLGQKPWYEWPLTALLSPYAWGVVICSGAGMILFQSALQRRPASIVVPLSHLTGIVYTVVVGSLLYGEALPSAPVPLALRLSGILLAVTATAVLGRTQARSERSPG